MKCSIHPSIILCTAYPTQTQGTCSLFQETQWMGYQPITRYNLTLDYRLFSHSRQPTVHVIRLGEETPKALGELTQHTPHTGQTTTIY